VSLRQISSISFLRAKIYTVGLTESFISKKVKSCFSQNGKLMKRKKRFSCLTRTQVRGKKCLVIFQNTCPEARQQLIIKKFWIWEWKYVCRKKTPVIEGWLHAFVKKFTEGNVNFFKNYNFINLINNFNSSEFSTSQETNAPKTCMYLLLCVGSITMYDYVLM
jgi:hypothetical protein